MSTGVKFLGRACLLISVPIVFRVAPGAAILMAAGLLGLAYFTCRECGGR